MKTTQLLALMVVIVGAVFGVTFLSQYSADDRPGPSVAASGPVAAAEQLRFPAKLVDWSKVPREVGRIDHEWGHEGSYAFWFENTGRSPVRLSLKRNSCKCSSIAVSLAGPKASDDVPHAPPTGATWEPLESEERALSEKRELPRPVVVPAQATGWIRITWKGERKTEAFQGELFWAELRTMIDDQPGTIIRLEIPVAFCDPVFLESSQLAVGDIRPGGQVEGHVTVWTITRPELPVELRVEPPDPCITFGKPEPLGLEQVKTLMKALDKRATPLRIGYRVPVIVRERAESGVQMDLGHFRRRLTVHTFPDVEPFQVVLGGVVRSDVVVESGLSRDLIDLGNFQAGDGVRVKARLSTDRSDLDVVLDELPSWLQAQLTPEQPNGPGRRWSLEVVVPPLRLQGSVPAGTALFLKIQSKPPRRLRVPLTGNATIR